MLNAEDGLKVAKLCSCLDVFWTTSILSLICLRWPIFVGMKDVKIEENIIFELNLMHRNGGQSLVGPCVRVWIDR